MNTACKKLFLYLVASSALIAGGARESQAAEAAAAASPDGVFGLPRSAVKPADAPTTETVGSLPYSTQWISEEISTYLYVSYNSAELASQTMTIGDYSADFGSASYAYPTLDFFMHFFSLANPESKSIAKDFSLWGSYSLGFASRTATLNNLQSTLDSSVEKDSLLVFSSRFGALLGYDRLSWVRPYIGMEVSPYFFRNTADISGAEQQGGAFCYGPVIGAHFPVFFSGRASLHAEYRKTFAIQDQGQIFGNSDNYSAGLGLTF